MNSKNLLVFFFSVSLLLFSYQHSDATALNGTYTIDPAATASTTSFKNVVSAVAFLTGTGSRTDGGPANSAPFGVSGPVVFLIAPGTYTGQVVITGNISGASLANTVTFQGSNQATCIITYSSSSTTSRHTVKLDNVRYVTFRNVTIRSTGTQGWPVHITTANANANGIKQCLIDITGAGTTSTSATNFAGIVISGSTSTPTTGVRIDSLEIDSNIINYGYYGIIATGLTGNQQLSNKFRNNRIYNSYSTGIYNNFQDGAVISGNIIATNSQNTASTGIYVLNSAATASGAGIEVSGNKVTGFGTYGIRFNNVQNNTPGHKGKIINNMIGGGVLLPASYGIHLTSSGYFDVIHNTVNHDANTTLPSHAALYISGGSNNNVLNNILSSSKAGAGLPLYITPASAADTIDYNVYHRADTFNGELIYVGGFTFGPSNFKGVMGHDSNSVFNKPLFVNDTNLHLLNGCNKGITWNGIATDIDGTARGIPPVIGAHEYIASADNLSVLAVVAPTFPVSTGLQDLTVRVQNSGNNPIYDFNIAYVHNNGTVVSQPWSGMLNACDTVSVTLGGANSVNLVDVNYITVYTYLPNANPDANAADDTLRVKYYHVLNGAYTVGDSASDFKTITDARDALQQRGVSGPVTLNIVSGTYNGQLMITGPIPGASAISTVTFNGDTASGTTITSSVSSGATVALNQCDYVTLRNLRISNTAASGNCAAVAVIGSNTSSAGSSNSIVGCELILPNNGSGLSNAIGVMVTGSANGYAQSDNRIDSLTIDSNMITGANNGIYICGNAAAASGTPVNTYNKGYSIRNNNITSTVSSGDNCIFINNILNGIDVSGNSMISSTGSGLYLYRCLNDFPGNAPHLIHANKIRCGQVGINVQEPASGIANATQIYNNDIIITSALAGVGIYYSSPGTSQVDEIYHNSLLIDSASSPILGYGLYYFGSPDSKIKNNIFAFTGTGTSVIYPVYILSGVSGNNLNHNLYYNAAMDSLVYRNGVSVGSANFLTDTTAGDSSFNMAPAFISNMDLRLTSGCPRGFDLTANVPADLEGTARSTSPSMGAYEFVGYSNDMAIAAIHQPASPVAAGPQDVYVKVINNGSNAVSSFDISYTLNNGTPVTQNWIGLLLPCDTTSVLFTGGNQADLLNGINDFKVYTSLPNGFADGNNLNDTFSRQFAPPMHGNYVVGTAPSDYADLTSAVSALMQRGVDGQVNVLIKTGTYLETISIPSILGSSSANTISFGSMAGHRDSVIIRHTGASQYVLNIASSSNIIIRDLSIDQQNNALFASALLITGSSSSDTIENCYISTVIDPSSQVMCINTSSMSGTGLVIRNNSFSGGYAGVALNPLDPLLSPANRHISTTVEGNSFRDHNTAATYCYGSKNLIFRNNTITGDSNNTAFDGLQCMICDSAFNISGNFIRNIPGGNGIYLEQSAGSNDARGLISNNDIAIGNGNHTTAGIRLNGVTYADISHNSVNILATLSASTYAVYLTSAGLIDLNNNILVNSGGGYSIFTSSPFAITASDYNNFYTTGTNLARVNTINQADLQTWRVSTGGDLHSVSVRPGFTSATDLHPDLNDSIIWLMNGTAIHVAGDTTDFSGAPRPDEVNEGAPDFGAYEFTPLSFPPFVTPVPATPVAGTTQAFLLLGDTVAKIYWDPVNPVPDVVTVRQYSGVAPPLVLPTDNYMYFYLDIKAEGNGGYVYDIDVFYRDSWLGTNPSEADIRLIKRDSASPWLFPPVVSTDTSLNILNGTFLTSFSLFTGTDMYSPLPVTLTDLSGKRIEGGTQLSWKTASEHNTDYFIVERSSDKVHFEQAGTVAAAGESSKTLLYRFTDVSSGAQAKSVLYYRLKTVDRDGSQRISNIVTILPAQLQTSETAEVYPNPFNTLLEMNITAANDVTSFITITDITGQMAFNKHLQLHAGDNHVELTTDLLKPGIYFLVIETEGKREVKKIIKE